MNTLQEFGVHPRDHDQVERDLQISPEEYKKLITELGMTQVGAARFLGIDESTSRRWVAGKNPVPRPVALLLYAMRRYAISPMTAIAIMRERREREP